MDTKNQKRNGKLIGRRLLIEGEQYVDDGIFKKGEYYSFIGPYYGEGGGGSTTDHMIVDYAKNNRTNIYKNSYSNLSDITTNERVTGRIIIQLQETDFDLYPAFDTVYISNEERLLCSNSPTDYHGMKKWTKAYKAGHSGYTRV